MVVSCYLRNYNPMENCLLSILHSSLMVWLWLMVHSTQGSRYSDPSRYKGRALWWHFMGVVHVKVLCVASQKNMIQVGTNHSYTPFWDQFKFVIKLDVQSIPSPPPLHYGERLWQWNVESPQNTCKGCPMQIQKSIMCGHGLSNVM
jgi:hypothetical protein